MTVEIISKTTECGEPAFLVLIDGDGPELVSKVLLESLRGEVNHATTA